MGRRDVRTFHHPEASPAAPPVEQVQDPATRAIFLTIARALSMGDNDARKLTMITAEIYRRCGATEPPEPP